MKILSGILHNCASLRLLQCTPNVCVRLGKNSLKDHAGLCNLTKAQWIRSISGSCNRLQIKKNSITEKELALARPRLFKQYEKARAEDNVSKDWTIIFDQGYYQRKLTIASWCCSLFAAAFPFVLAYAYWQTREEENVIFCGMEISNSTQAILFILCNAFIAVVIWRTIVNVPKRIYLNATNNYVAILRGHLPWNIYKFEFKATDIRPTIKTKVPYFIKPWKDHEFIVKKRVLVLHPFGFRSGHDRSWLLRHVQ